MIEPQIVIGNRHLVKRDFFGVFEEAIRPPDRVQPLHVENPILLTHVFRKPKAGVAPASSAVENAKANKSIGLFDKTATKYLCARKMSVT